MSCWPLELIIRLLPRYSQQRLSLFSPHHDMQCFPSVHVYLVESGRPMGVLPHPGITPSRNEVCTMLKHLVRRIR